MNYLIAPMVFSLVVASAVAAASPAEAGRAASGYANVQKMWAEARSGDEKYAMPESVLELFGMTRDVRTADDQGQQAPAARSVGK